MTKKLYVFENVAPVSSAYHDGGGLVIVTSGDPIVAWRGSDSYSRGEYGKEEADLSNPDMVYDVADDAPDAVIVFPDAGCC